MRRRILCLLLFSFLLTSLSLCICTNRAQASGSPKKVFILQSYELGQICGHPQYEGAVAALNQAGWRQGLNIEFATYCMDTKVTNNTPELIEQQAAIALKIIASFKPDVLITIDDNAFRSVALPLVDSGLPIVFSGLNIQPEDYNRQQPFMKSRQRPGGNVTGVYEKLHVLEAVRVISKIISVPKIRFLSDTSPIGKAVAHQIDLELLTDNPGLRPPALVDFQVIDTWEGYQRAIEKINSDPDIGAFYLGALLLSDKTGRVYSAPDIIKWTLVNSRKPAIGINYDFIRLGLLGGATVDFFAMGQQAGRLAVAILQGKPAGTLPIEDAQRMGLVFNLKRASDLGIEIPSDILLAADEVFGHPKQGHNRLQ